ncbi:DNA helicase RecG, partial [Bacillus spizizenii]|nr:DNA helicase RecG [Bacillus spizizenii]
VGHYLVTAVCFNRPYLKKKLSLGSVVTVSGKWDKHRQTISVQELKNGQHQEDKSIEPEYSVKEKVTDKMIRSLIKKALT